MPPALSVFQRCLLCYVCPQKKLGIVIPFKELIKRALGFVRGAGRGEKEKKKNLCGSWAYPSWELEYRLVAGNNTICNIRINSFISNFLIRSLF